MDAVAPPKIDQPGNGHWTEKRLEELIARWKNGESATMIAVAMNTSRNAVLGKTWRLGLRRAEIIQFRPKPRAPRRQGRHKTGRAPTKPAEQIPPIFVRPKAFAELTALECHWPGDGGRFCAAPVVGGKPYCLAHCRVAFIVPTSRPRA